MTVQISLCPQMRQTDGCITANRFGQLTSPFRRIFKRLVVAMISRSDQPQSILRAFVFVKRDNLLPRTNAAQGLFFRVQVITRIGIMNLNDGSTRNGKLVIVV